MSLTSLRPSSEVASFHALSCSLIMSAMSSNCVGSGQGDVEELESAEPRSSSDCDVDYDKGCDVDCDRGCGEIECTD